MTPCACIPSLLVSIKGGGGRFLRGVGSFGRTQRFALLAEHTCSSEPRYWHSPQSTPLAETRELPSLSRLACTSYYKHPRYKTVQCSRTPLCWTYGTTAGTRINPCVTMLPLASTSGTRNTQHHHWLGPDHRVRTPTPSTKNASGVSPSQGTETGIANSAFYFNATSTGLTGCSGRLDRSLVPVRPVA